MNRQPQRLADLLPAVVADLANRHHHTNGAPPAMTEKPGNAALRVTVEDLETGETQTAYIPLHDYLMIATGDCRYSVQAYATGTHQITVRGRKQAGAA